MKFCKCCDTKENYSVDQPPRNSILFVFTKEQIKSKIETQYERYLSGELKCTPREGEIIKNNYNSRRKIDRLL